MSPPADQDPDREPLHQVAGRGDVATLRARLDAGENPDVARSGATVLGWAISKGHVAAAELLLERGAQLVGPGVDPQLYTCVTQCPALLSRLLARGGDPNASFGPLGTALHAAAQQGDRAGVQLLVGAGADVNAVSGKGQTPLSLAAHHGHLEIVELLLACGASVHARIGPERQPLLETALVGRHQAVVDCLRRAVGLAPRPVRDLLADEVLAAARDGDAPRVARWLDHDASVDGRDPQGRTPLHLAAGAGHEAIAAQLVAAGADVAAVDAGGQTPGDLAAARKHERLLALLARPSRMKPDVQKLRRWARGDAPPDEVAAALDLLEVKSFLAWSLTSAELRRVRRGGERGERLTALVGPGHGPSLGPCPRCGRPTVDDASCSVLHGNPATPASDTEVEWSATCSSCGAEVTENA
jgi:ankyrin repeat protein